MVTQLIANLYALYTLLKCPSIRAQQNVLVLFCKASHSINVVGCDLLVFFMGILNFLSFIVGLLNLQKKSSSLKYKDIIQNTHIPVYIN